ncbi:hypothetical protein ACHMW8_08860 [Caulobacter sp. UC70_42]
MQDDLDAGVLLVEEDRAEVILLDDHAEARGLERLVRTQPRRLGLGGRDREYRTRG